ncbi:MFS transporter [Priestia filamentosa]|uniref:MFS transporter n=2 Tax=Priestia filamentosa TaxID=1402861 RepID=UPI001FB53129|nr:MFS transporter [Priestia filamentosa]UOE58699.1 MFS transporter [Priestia filamentosa]
MNTFKRESSISFIIRVFNAVGIFIFTPLLALWLINTKNITVGEASVIVATFTFFQKAGSIFTGGIINKFGVKNSLLAGLWGTALTLVMINYIRNFVLLIAIVIILGILISLYNISLKTHISYLEEKERITAFAMLNIALNVGASIGPVIGGWFLSWNPHTLMLASSAGFIIAGISALFLKKDKPTGEASERLKLTQYIKENYKKPELISFVKFLIFSGFFWFLYGHVFATFPVVMADYFNAKVIGTFFTINAVTVIVMQIVFIKCKDVFSINAWYVISLGLISLSFFLIWSSPTYMYVFIGILIFSFAEVIWVPNVDNGVVKARGSLSPPWAFAISGIIWGMWQSLSNVVGLNIYRFFKEDTFFILCVCSLLFMILYGLSLALTKNKRKDQGVSSKI